MAFNVRSVTQVQKKRFTTKVARSGSSGSFFIQYKVAAVAGRMLQKRAQAGLAGFAWNSMAQRAPSTAMVTGRFGQSIPAI